MVAMRAITPKRRNHLVAVGRTITQSMDRELDRLARGVLADFHRVTATWSHRVAFKVEKFKRGFARGRRVYTDDKIFKYVEFGTRPHVIVPRRAKLLRFQTDYQAKTKPGRLTSGPGGARGPTVFARAVSHPGTEGRHFRKTIKKKWEPRVTRRLRGAVKVAVR